MYDESRDGEGPLMVSETDRGLSERNDRRAELVGTALAGVGRVIRVLRGRGVASNGLTERDDRDHAP